MLLKYLVLQVGKFVTLLLMQADIHQLPSINNLKCVYFLNSWKKKILSSCGRLLAKKNISQGWFQHWFFSPLLGRSQEVGKVLVQSRTEGNVRGQVFHRQLTSKESKLSASKNTWAVTEIILLFSCEILRLQIITN